MELGRVLSAIAPAKGALLQAISEHAALDVLLPLLLVVTDHDEHVLFCRAEHVQPFQLGRQSVLVFLDPSRIFAANQAESPNNLVPWSFSRDGSRLAYREVNPENGFDLWTLPLDITDPDHPKPGKPEPFLRTLADELAPRFSPDGRWIAYRSNESGNAEIYVRPYPAGNVGKSPISSGGGLYALWANNGRELYYETADNRTGSW